MIQQAALAGQTTKVQADIEELKAWRKVVDTVGSPQLMLLQKDVADLRKEFELHRATTLRTTP